MIWLFDCILPWFIWFWFRLLCCSCFIGVYVYRPDVCQLLGLVKSSDKAEVMVDFSTSAGGCWPKDAPFFAARSMRRSRFRSEEAMRPLLGVAWTALSTACWKSCGTTSSSLVRGIVKYAESPYSCSSCSSYCLEFILRNIRSTATAFGTSELSNVSCSVRLRLLCTHWATNW